MTQHATSRSAAHFPVGRLTEASRRASRSSLLARRESRTGPRSALLVTDPIEPLTPCGSQSSVTQRQESVSPHRLLPRYCRVKGCGKRVVRGRLGFLQWVHAEHADFAHYARG